MKPRRFRERAARRQRGFALIAILALAALIAAFLISSGLSRSSTDIANEREQRTMNALRQAKAALIAYAAAADWRLQAPGGAAYLQPGALPCPDTTGNGTATCSGSNTSSQIGRLPWITMGIDDLRDASGEKIWYALSHNFRKMQCTNAPPSPDTPNGCTRINSDTQGQLTVTGTESASNVVAVLIAPGGALSGQVRPSNAPADYVESCVLPCTGINFTFTTNAIPDQTNNDRIVVITQQELMAAVEPVVAARLERDIAPLIQTYYNKWGAYPYPTAFDPAKLQTAYKGANTSTTINQGGLLPVTTDPTYLFWVVPITVTQIPGGTGNGAPGPDFPASCSATYFGGGGGGGISGGPHCTLTEADCSHSTPSAIICEVRYFGGSADSPAISIKATLANAGFSFPAAFTPAWTTMIGDDGNPLASDNSHASTDPNFTGQWNWSAPPAVPTTAYSFSLTAAGRVNVTFTGRLQNAGAVPGGTNGRVVLTIPVPAFDTITKSDWNASADTAWFIANDWFRQTYYAVSPAYLPTGGNTCASGPCLLVNNLRPAYTPNNQNKQAVLVLAGRSFTGLPRTTVLSQYFEGANLTAANGTTPYIYENRMGVPTSINDRVVVVSPPPP